MFTLGSRPVVPPDPVAVAGTALVAGPSRPAHPGLLRELNERYVLNTIRALRPISRAEVARQTGLSKPTVSLALSTLQASGLVTAAGVEPGRPGRSGLLFEPVADAVLGVGVEIGVFGVRGALVDLDGTVLAERATAVAERSAAAIFAAVASTVEALARAVERPAGDIVALAVGTPGVIHPSTGRLSQAGTLPELDGSEPAAALAAKLGVAVSVFNDVDLAAVAEQSMGHGRDVDDFAVLWVGPGLGAALVLDGRLHLGTRGGAGEVFDVPFADVAAAPIADGPDPESVAIDASEAGTIALAAALAPRHPSTALRPPFGASAILDAARLGDPLGVGVRDRLARWIAWYAATVTAVVDPQLVILAGPIGAHDALLDPVNGELGRLLAAPPRLVSSELGDRSVLVGAIARVRDDAEQIAFATRSQERTR